MGKRVFAPQSESSSSPEMLLSAHTAQLTAGGTVHSHLLVGCRPYFPTYNTQTEHTPFKA